MIVQLQSEARHAVESMNNAQSTANEGMSRVKEAADALYSMTEQVARMNRLSEETFETHAGASTGRNGGQWQGREHP